MRALRLSLASAVILALTAGWGGLALAQADEAGGDSGPFFAEFADVSMSEMQWEPGPGYGRLNEWEMAFLDVVATDPRFSGTWRLVMNGHGFGAPGTSEAFSVYSGTARLENEQGTWVGEVQNLVSEPYERMRLVVEGEDAFAGWSAIIDQADADWSGFRGLVFEGGVPTMPEPLEAAAPASGPADE